MVPERLLMSELSRELEDALEDGETVYSLFPVRPLPCLCLIIFLPLTDRSDHSFLFLVYEKLVLKVEARDCHKVWTCKGQNRCWEDCKNRYTGTGLCDLYTAPPVPKQCFCAYKC
ncbi:hypothetical protein POTOM_045088 [Populus tomentosa]|uniref:Uncharacterized protein n=1 Tax=Populus tomentosa TaxID=118781 RepID=A0A8X8CDN3_POPTO|nr:hypothetical protein POTOM_045088 [Populus tomentosa]